MDNEMAEHVMLGLQSVRERSEDERERKAE